MPIRPENRHRYGHDWKTAYYSTRLAGEKIEHDGQIDVHVTFYPPDKRKRDGTNLLGSLKAAFDGIADALGVDDVRFHVRYEIGGIIGGGEVRVILA